MTRSALHLTTIAILIPAALIAQTRPKTGPRASPIPTPPAPTRWTMPADSSNSARFTVREQLAGAELPNDVVGTTKVLSGGLVVDAAGKMDSSASKIVVDMRTLATDRANRDRYFKGRTIVTDSFPNATFTATEVRLTSGSLSSSGPIAGTIVGFMTLHGVTRPMTWDITGTLNGGDLKGNATTHVHFGDFNMTQPRVMMVLSIVDDLKLDYDFHFVKP